MELLARTRIVLWQGGGLWVVDATPAAGRERKQTDFHAHHAIQVVLGLGGAFQLQTGSEQVGGEAVAVAADVPHAFAAEGLLALLFVEPESRIGRSLAARLFVDRKLVSLSPAEIAGWSGPILDAYRAGSRRDDTLVALGQSLARSLAADAAGDRPDHRVRKMIARANEGLDRPIGLSDVVDVGGLSAARLRHLFVEQTGLPFKTYVLWLRLTKAVEQMAAGSSLTQAAHEAGFADSAHFSRTFKRMFGVTPAALRIA